MRLTWKDVAATAIVAGVGGLYAWHRAAPDTAFVGSARWLAVTVFVLGVAACATGSAFTGTGVYSGVMSSGGAVAFALLITTLVTGSSTVLAVLVAVVGLLWLVTTVRHALGIYPPAATAPVPDGSHEAIRTDLHVS